MQGGAPPNWETNVRNWLKETLHGPRTLYKITALFTIKLYSYFQNWGATELKVEFFSVKILNR